MRKMKVVNRNNRSQKRKRRKSNRKLKQIKSRSIVHLENKSKSRNSRNNKRVKSRSRIHLRRVLLLICMNSLRLTFVLARSFGLKRIQIVKSFTTRKLT